MSPNHFNTNNTTHNIDQVRSILHAIPALHSKMNDVILALQEQYFPLSVERLLLYQEIQKILRLEDLNHIKVTQIKKIDPRIIQEIEVWCKLQKLQNENQNV